MDYWTSWPTPCVHNGGGGERAVQDVVVGRRAGRGSARGRDPEGFGDMEGGYHVVEFVLLISGYVSVVFCQNQLLETVVDFQCRVSDVL